MDSSPQRKENRDLPSRFSEADRHQHPILLPRHRQRKNPHRRQGCRGPHDQQISHAFRRPVHRRRPVDGDAQPEVEGGGSGPGAVRVGRAAGAGAVHGPYLRVHRRRVQRELHMHFGEEFGDASSS